jgi:hypothetical protein
VGRGPLDEEAIRLIEAGNPDLEFDWTRILKGQPAPEPQAERRGPDRERRGQDREGARERERDRRKPSPAAASLPAPVVETPPAVEPPTDEERVAVEEEPTSAAHARLGSEGLARLRARYSEMRARITDRVSDPGRQDELKSLAERLNPDAWVTEADVNAALESYESTFAALRAEFIPARPAPPSAPADE